MSILSVNTKNAGMSCLTALKLYRCIVIPRALYGAELWYHLTHNHLAKLEAAHNGAIRCIQNFPKCSSATIARSMVNEMSLVEEIDKKKLTILGRLCRLKNTALAKRIFVERLYQSQGPGPKFGYIRDIIEILKKYNLEGIVFRFMDNSNFPSKGDWKKLVRTAVRRWSEQLLTTKLSQPKYRRFEMIRGGVFGVNAIWTLEHRTRGRRQHLRDLARLNCVVHDTKTYACTHCDRAYTDILNHLFHHCVAYREAREYFWALIVNTCEVPISAYLYNLEEIELTRVMLGKPPDIEATLEQLSLLTQICANAWQRMSYDKMLKFY